MEMAAIGAKQTIPENLRTEIAKPAL